jgi:hypothetical protein
MGFHRKPPLIMEKIDFSKVYAFFPKKYREVLIMAVKRY